MTKLILYKGDVETTAFFLSQMGREFIKQGYEIYEFCFEEERKKAGKEQQTEQMVQFIEPGQTIMLAFNFAGVYGEDKLTVEDGTLFVDAYHLPYYNIVVDHPYHYHAHLSGIPRIYHQINIDRNHIKYMERYFPKIDVLPFMPSAGTTLWESYPSLTERPYDVVMTGSYIPPEAFYVFMDRHGEEYGAFYRGMLKELLAQPDKLLEDVARAHLVREIPEATEEELQETLGHIQFLDYYIRFFVRKEAVKSLVDGGVKVFAFGGGWENFVCDCPQNFFFETEEGKIISLAQAKDREDAKSAYLTSKQCLERIRQAKISLNVMPWFRDGAHDRIYNSMLNGAVSLTDDNPYLRRTLRDGENVCFYDLEKLEELPRIAKELLTDAGRMEKISRNAYGSAIKEHTWQRRAGDLIGYIKEREQ